MTSQEIMDKLAKLGNENTKNIFMKHGAKEPFFGVKVADLKPFQKAIKKDYELSLELFETGNSDAMYLAGLIADESKMTKADLQNWVKKAYWYMISEYTVAWIAAESHFGYELAREWIESDQEQIATCGWSTLSNLVSIKPDSELNSEEIEKLLDRVSNNIHSSQNRVRFTMNGFVIAVGAYISSLTDKAKNVARKIGRVEVEMGGTACKVPDASDYIAKIEQKGRIGIKRKMARC